MSAFPWDLVSPTSGAFAGSQVWLALELASCYTSEGPKWGSTPQGSGEALTRGQGEKSEDMRKQLRVSTERGAHAVTWKDTGNGRRTYLGDARASPTGVGAGPGPFTDAGRLGT